MKRSTLILIGMMLCVGTFAQSNRNGGAGKNLKLAETRMNAEVYYIFKGDEKKIRKFQRKIERTESDYSLTVLSSYDYQKVQDMAKSMYQLSQKLEGAEQDQLLEDAHFFQNAYLPVTELVDESLNHMEPHHQKIISQIMKNASLVAGF